MIRKVFVVASWVSVGVIAGSLGLTTSLASSTVTAQTTGVAEVDKTQLQKRLQERVAKLQTKITVAEQAKLKTRCVTAQGKITSLQARLTGVQTSRDSAYEALIARLSLLNSRLQRQDVDTEIQLHIDKLKALIATYEADFLVYKQAVSDAAIMDCEANPTAFKAALQDARTLRATVVKDTTAIKSYMTTTVRPYLQNVKTSVESKEAN